MVASGIKGRILDEIDLEQMLENSKALGFLKKIDLTRSTLISTS